MVFRIFSSPIAAVVTVACLAITLMLAATADVPAQDIKKTELYARIKGSINAVPAIDTHDHVRGFAEIPHRVDTPAGNGMTLFSIWRQSYFSWTSPVADWPASGEFSEWWKLQQPNFADAKATSFYRYMLPAFRDLYEVDFDNITDEQAKKLNDDIFAHYKNDKWLLEVVTERANIELMLIDPYWARLKFPHDYHFTVQVLNVSTIMKASHPEQCTNPLDSPWWFAGQNDLPIETFDEFLAVIEAIFQKAVESDCLALKTTQAYERTLRFEQVSRKRAAELFMKPRAEITNPGQQEFEDFMFHHFCELSAKYELPFQIHTGQARVQGSNPMLLVDSIAAHPDTKFVLFHGGYPWVGETAVIAMRHKNVWIDSVWLPTLSYTMGKRAFQEWLEAVPSDRIMWGADAKTAEEIYAATEFTRQCLAEALAEKVERGELREDDALRIGRQIMRDNALKLFPKMNRMLWKK